MQLTLRFFALTFTFFPFTISFSNNASLFFLVAIPFLLVTVEFFCVAITFFAFTCAFSKTDLINIVSVYALLLVNPHIIDFKGMWECAVVNSFYSSQPATNG